MLYARSGLHLFNSRTILCCLQFNFLENHNVHAPTNHPLSGVCVCICMNTRSAWMQRRKKHFILERQQRVVLSFWAKHFHLNAYLSVDVLCGCLMCWCCFAGPPHPSFVRINIFLYVQEDLKMIHARTYSEGSTSQRHFQHILVAFSRRRRRHIAETDRQTHFAYTIVLLPNEHMEMKHGRPFHSARRALAWHWAGLRLGRPLLPLSALCLTQIASCCCDAHTHTLSRPIGRGVAPPSCRKCEPFFIAWQWWCSCFAPS